DLKGGLIHFALTTQTADLAAGVARSQPAADAPAGVGRLEVNIDKKSKADVLPSRRIYFLAVNHAVPELGGANGLEVRKLLAHGIQRDAILTECFRAGFAEYHKPLTGPFPPGT